MIDGSLVALKQNLNQDAKRNFAHSHIKISKTEYLIMYLLYSIKPENTLSKYKVNHFCLTDFKFVVFLNV